jgi:hypothetical protein
METNNEHKQAEFNLFELIKQRNNAARSKHQMTFCNAANNVIKLRLMGAL